MYRFHEAYFNVPNPETVVQTKESIWPSALGAFLGAFFAFTFGIIAFYLQRRFERYSKHKNSVVEIEQLLNDHLNNRAANKYLLEGAIKTLRLHHVTYTLLTPFRLPEDIELRIGDLEVLHEYSEYKDPVEKLNHSMLTWQGLNEKLQENLIANPTLPAPIVHANMKQVREQAEALIKFLEGLDADTNHFLAYIRIYLRKDKNILSIWLLKRKNKNKPIITEKEIQKELEVLKSEIDEITSKSRERIAKITDN